MHPGALLLWRRSCDVLIEKLNYIEAAAVEERWGTKIHQITLVPRRSSTAAAPGYLLWQSQLAAGVAGPVRILPQFESCYTFPVWT